LWKGKRKPPRFFSFVLFRRWRHHREINFFATGAGGIFAALLFAERDELFGERLCAFD